MLRVPYLVFTHIQNLGLSGETLQEVFVFRQGKWERVKARGVSQQIVRGKTKYPWQLPIIFKRPLYVLLIAQINSSPGQRELLFHGIPRREEPEIGWGQLPCHLQSCFLMIFHITPHVRRRKLHHLSQSVNSPCYLK